MNENSNNSPNLSVTNTEPVDHQSPNQLYPEDQARVDGYLKQGYNSVERKPFHPLRLLAILMVAVSALTVLSLWLAKLAGVE